MKPCPTLSVVIPVYQNSDLTNQVLTDIFATLGVSDTEVIVVDDGSTDNTAEVVSRFPQATYIKHEQNRGVAPAWNTGIKAATGDYVCIVNNDIRIADLNWASKTIDALAHKKVIVGPELVNFNSASEYKGKNQPYLNGFFFAFPRRLFYEIGFFNEAFAPASFEDVDLCTRAQFAGYKLEVLEGLRVQHMVSKTVGKFLRSEMPALNQRNRQIWLNTMAQLDRPRLRIVIDCPSNGRKWGPRDLEETGLGGAETALTLLTRELVTRGHEVYVFNDKSGSDQAEGVSYHNRSTIPELGLDCDVFITFRCPSEYITNTTARRKIFWSCDQQTTGNWQRDIFPHVDEIVCISDYHADYMAQNYGVDRSRITVIGCPVRHWDYEPHLEKDPNQFIYCSVPHRGLEYMPMVMREIRKERPDAKLVITSDYRLWGADEPRNAEFRSNPLLTKEQFLGKVDRSDLIRLQGLSVAQPYPCTYLECFCIAVAECSAAGAVPISTDIGAVSQTVGGSGYIVGKPDGDFAQRIARITIEAIRDPGAALRAIESSWRWSVVSIGSQWEELCYRGLDLGVRQTYGVPADYALSKPLPPSPPPTKGRDQLKPGQERLPNGDIVSTRSSA